MHRQKSFFISLNACLLIVFFASACQPSPPAGEEKGPVIDGKTRLAMFEKHKTMEQTSEFKDTSLFPAYQKYMQIIISEQKILLEDINTFLNDLRIQKKDS